VFAYLCPRQGEDLEQAWVRQTTTNAISIRPSVPFSGLPLGTHLRRYESAASVSLRVRNGDTFSFVRMDRRGTGPKGNVTWHASDRDGDRIDIEGISRRLIALVEGRWSTDAGEVTFNGVRLTTRRGRGGQQFVDLSRWAQAVGVTVNWNRRLGTASFTYGDRPYVVALGARSIKVGNTWREIGDTIMMRDDEWYVPVRELGGN